MGGKSRKQQFWNCWKLRNTSEKLILTISRHILKYWRQINFCLPISLALNLAGISDPRVHAPAHSILTEIGYFLQVTRDYVNCYVDPFGTDIKDGRMTWLVILARQRANASQLATLEECYGRPEVESVAEVKRIYKVLISPNQIARKKVERKCVGISQKSILRLFL